MKFHEDDQDIYIAKSDDSQSELVGLGWSGKVGSVKLT